MFLRAMGNYDTMAASDESGLECKDKSLAKQNEKEEADINTIVKRFGITGQLPQNVRAPQYGDFTEVTDYHTAMNAVRNAEIAFMQMPADIRSRFENDPQAFLEFCSDPANLEEMRKMGLVTETLPAPGETSTLVSKPTDTPPAGAAAVGERAPATT